MATDGKKGKGRVVIAPVRVTKETHVRMKTLAALWHMSMSETINKLIDEVAPQVDDVIREREEQERRFGKQGDSVND